MHQPHSFAERAHSQSYLFVIRHVIPSLVMHDGKISSTFYHTRRHGISGTAHAFVREDVYMNIMDAAAAAGNDVRRANIKHTLANECEKYYT
jgi:hypothetical protein